METILGHFNQMLEEGFRLSETSMNQATSSAAGLPQVCDQLL